MRLEKTVVIKNIIGALIFLGLSAIIIWGITQVPTAYDGVKFTVMWPILIVSGLIFAAMFVLITSLIKLNGFKGEAKKNEMRDDENTEESLVKCFLLKINNKYSKVIILMAISLLYTYFLNIFGFWLCTFAYAGIITWISGEKKILRSLGCAFLITLTLDILFARIVGTPLPRGQGIFDKLSLMINSIK